MSLSLSICPFIIRVPIGLHHSYRIFLQLIIIVVDPLLRLSSSKVCNTYVLTFLKMILFNQVL